MATAFAHQAQTFLIVWLSAVSHCLGGYWMQIDSSTQTAEIGSSVNITCTVYNVVIEPETHLIDWDTAMACTEHWLGVPTTRNMDENEGMYDPFTEDWAEVCHLRNITKSHEGYYICKAAVPSKTYYNETTNVAAKLHMIDVFFLQVTHPLDHLLNFNVRYTDTVSSDFHWLGFVNISNGPIQLSLTMEKTKFILVENLSANVFTNRASITIENEINLVEVMQYILVVYESGYFSISLFFHFEPHSIFHLNRALSISATVPGEMISKTLPLDDFHKDTKFLHDFQVFPLLKISPNKTSPRSEITASCVILGTQQNDAIKVKMTSPAEVKNGCPGEEDSRSSFVTFETNASPAKSGRAAVFVANFAAAQTGFVECGYGNSLHREYICVTNVAEIVIQGINQRKRRNELAEGATLHIKCIAPPCTADNEPLKSLNMQWRSDQRDSYGILKGLTNIDCRFSRQIIYTVENVSKQYSGIYTCSGVFENGQYEEASFNVTIIDKAEKSISNVIKITVFSLAGFILIFLITFCVFYRKSQTKKCQFHQLLNGGKTVSIDANLTAFEQIECLPFDKKWAFPRNKLSIGTQLGAGYFGIVYIGMANFASQENTTEIAIKTTKPNCSSEIIESLIKELKIMSHLGKHPNIVGLLGAVTDRLSHGELMILMELCRYGNLRQYLLDNSHKYASDDKISDKEMHQLNSQVLIRWCYQISRGLAFLSSRHVVHGDLAARNILLAGNNIVKIADFGLSCNLNYDYIYKMKENVKLPFRWLAVESIEHHIFSIQSDVWSYGVAIWEIYTFGKVPYSDIEGLALIRQKVLEGHRLEKPETAPDDVYGLMKACWHADPGQRVSPKDISHQLSQLLDESVRDEYVKLENEVVSENNKLEGEDYLMMCRQPDYRRIPHYENVSQSINSYVDMSRSTKTAVPAHN